LPALVAVLMFRPPLLPLSLAFAVVVAVAFTAGTVLFHATI
jgi:hypothetical protein